jgi:hypothetical protein
MKMNDKDWLERVSIAYRAYSKPDQQISEFISWLYKQYGVIQPEDRKK